jgi:hypothetical protein
MYRAGFDNFLAGIAHRPGEKTIACPTRVARAQVAHLLRKSGWEADDGRILRYATVESRVDPVSLDCRTSSRAKEIESPSSGAASV